ncbi:MAG: YggS family pyridoxal phosphate-dependent enzyme [Legionella sp.]
MASHTIEQRLNFVKQRIKQAEQEYQRVAHSVELIAISKGQSIESIKEAYLAGQRHFGENYLQEGLAKMNQLTFADIIWHFIGPIQSNKVKAIAQSFTWVHSVSRFMIAKNLDAARDLSLPPLNICLQVNLDKERNKAGVSENELPDLARQVLELPRLKLRGVMAIPAPQKTLECQLTSLLRLNKLMHQLNKTFDLSLDTLSMGMSDDLEAAIYAGSTMVRVGKAIFGERQSRYAG